MRGVWASGRHTAHRVRTRKVPCMDPILPLGGLALNSALTPSQDLE